jgi:hypothetical protein
MAYKKEVTFTLWQLQKYVVQLYFFNITQLPESENMVASPKYQI